MLLCILGLACAELYAQPPHATVPIPTPLFTIDPASPSIGTLRARDILTKPGPTVAISGDSLGLNNENDQIDALSTGHSNVAMTDSFVFVFGVDRAAVGSADADPGLAAANRPFNVRDQAMRNQAAADIFMTLDAFTRNGPAPSPLRAATANNTLVKNQGDSGGGDLDLSPESSAAESNSGSQDNTTGTSYPPGATAFTAQRPGDGKQPAERSTEGGTTPFAIFFSVTKQSPSFGMGNGATVFVKPDPGSPGPTQIFVLASQIGLSSGIAGDEIDSMLIFDTDQDNMFDPGQDQVMFSLAPGSPSLIQPHGPGDIFSSRGFGTFQPLAVAADFGLAPPDNVDTLEIIRTTNVAQTVFDSAIFRVLPGDQDGNGVLTPADCAAFADCFSGPGVSYDTNGFATLPVSVGGPTNEFNPPSLQVETGDTIRWTWAGGEHNVVSGMPGSPNGHFYSGPPTSVIGTTFDLLADEPFLNVHTVGGAFFNYFCEVHGETATVRVVAHPCATFDMDYDGDVDCADWRRFKQLYLQQSGGTLCPPMPVSDFVTAILTKPQSSAAACMADLNDDGLVDARDIAWYIKALLGG